jgi:hypothetical protein
MQSSISTTIASTTDCTHLDLIERCTCCICQRTEYCVHRGSISPKNVSGSVCPTRFCYRQWRAVRGTRLPRVLEAVQHFLLQAPIFLFISFLLSYSSHAANSQKSVGFGVSMEYVTESFKRPADVVPPTSARRSSTRLLRAARRRRKRPSAILNGNPVRYDHLP